MYIRIYYTGRSGSIAAKYTSSTNMLVHGLGLEGQVADQVKILLSTFVTDL